jgi:hypothetical protein
MNECLNQPPQWWLIQGPNDGKMTTWLSEERHIPSMTPNTSWCGHQNTDETSCAVMCRKMFQTCGFSIRATDQIRSG